MSEALEWCRTMLPRVSRTFALGISALPQPFEQWVTAGYLLCRIVDTVEDVADLPWEHRRRIFMEFEDALMGGDPDPFQSSTSLLGGEADGDLCAHIQQVLSLMETFPPEVQSALRTWVGEMSYGMATYARRHTPGECTTLHDEDDLRRYCWYVAGTVGHLLTDLFVAGMPELRAQETRLRERATGFGLLLQMTNIVKDVTDDWEREWCFIPKSLQRAAGVPEGMLLSEQYRHEAQSAVDAVNRLAQSYFSDAVTYASLLPSGASEVRRFCLVPMLLAGRTLSLADGNPATLTPGIPVKVSRETVMAEIQRADRLIHDDAGIASLSLIPAA